MLGMAGLPLVNSLTGYYLRNYLPMLLVATVASTPLVTTRWQKMEDRGLKLAVLGLGLLVCTAYVVAGTYNPFLYFRF
jgi:alginate O-acetyltransferase complex protein AlgI